MPRLRRYSHELVRRHRCLPRAARAQTSTMYSPTFSLLVTCSLATFWGSIHMASPGPDEPALAASGMHVSTPFFLKTRAPTPVGSKDVTPSSRVLCDVILLTSSWMSASNWTVDAARPQSASHSRYRHITRAGSSIAIAKLAHGICSAHLGLRASLQEAELFDGISRLLWL